MIVADDLAWVLARPTVAGRAHLHCKRNPHAMSLSHASAELLDTATSSAPFRRCIAPAFLRRLFGFSGCRGPHCRREFFCGNTGIASALRVAGPHVQAHPASHPLPAREERRRYRLGGNGRWLGVGLSKGVTIDPKAFPIVRWRWKVGNLIEKGNPTTKSGDDYPARLYITFQREGGRTNAVDRAAAAMGRLLYGVELPYAAINYIWERHVQKEAICRMRIPIAYG